MSYFILKMIQITVALGLLNVWLLRANRCTAYRGGDAKTIREEFAVYGLPAWFCTFVGFLKVSIALALLVGLWIPALVPPASLLLACLMVGAVLMHAKVKDPVVKALPASVMLIMSLIIFFG